MAVLTLPATYVSVRPRSHTWDRVRNEGTAAAERTVTKQECTVTESMEPAEMRTIGLRTMTLSADALAEVWQVLDGPAAPIREPAVLPPLPPGAPRRLR